MRTVNLGDKEFAATFISPMRDVTGEVEATSTWPYVEAIPGSEIGLLAPLSRSVSRAYRSGDSRFHHFLIPTSGSNVYVVVVAGDVASSILGHYVIDLNEKYGLQAPPIVAAWRTSRDLCAKHHVTPNAPTSMDAVAVALNTLRDDPINGLRLKPEGVSSGWFIWGGEESTDPDFFQNQHIAHLAEQCPEVLPYLALPPGWRFLLGANSYVDVWYDEGVFDD